MFLTEYSALNVCVRTMKKSNNKHFQNSEAKYNERARVDMQKSTSI